LEKSCGSDDCSFFSRHTVIQRKAQEYETAKTPCMKQWIKDTAGLGTALWLIGYLASLVLFFSPFTGIMGWVLLAIFTPITVAITWWWFRRRERLPVQYYAGVGVACIAACRLR
jgi:hypothetical protein